MEIYQLKYFVEVAKHENMNQVTRELGISTPALSKAISLLEHELGEQLFDRVGRNIKLTQAGGLFFSRATAILDLVEASKLELSSGPKTLNVAIAGRELFLGWLGLSFTKQLKEKYENVQCRLLPCSGEEAIQLAASGGCDFLFSTQKPSRPFVSKLLCEFEMATWIGERNPLFNKKNKAVDIKEVLKHPFAAPNTAIFGGSPKEGTYDGWRDDVFPRKIEFVTSSLSLLTEVTKNGLALTYLPDFYGESAGLHRLKITGCNLNCSLKVYFSTAKYDKLGWVAQAFDNFKM